MADNVDMSLDDIIKKNRSKSRGGGGGGKRNLLKQLAQRSGLSTRGRKPQNKQAPVKHTQLHISNLEFGVSNQDIKELFSTFGNLKKAAVHYDKSGRSLGTAEVIFTSKQSALSAMKQYNNVPLDGRSMDIKLVSSQVDSRIGPKPGGIAKRNLNRGSTTRGRGRGPSSRGRGRAVKKTPTADELDADLEDYKMSVE